MRNIPQSTQLAMGGDSSFLDSPKVPAAIFDFDGTLIRSDSAKVFLAFLWRHHPRTMADLPRFSLSVLSFALGWTSRDRVKHLAVHMLRRVPSEDHDQFFREFHDQKLLPRYLAGGIDRIRWHRERNHLLVLASASFDIYLKHVARTLGFDLLVCTRTVLGSQAGLAGPNCRGAEKLRLIRSSAGSERIDWSGSWVYSDSLSDLPLFSLCGHPVAANPSRHLRRYAKKAGWMVMEW